MKPYIANVRQFDVVVVGAGPAGCAAAYDLACAKLRVLILDHKSFPRMKPCAGALTIKAVNRLRYSIAPVVQFVARDLNVSLNREQRWVLPSESPVVVMTVRQELDAFCLERTLEKGAEFETIEELVSVAEDETGVTLTTGDETLRCHYLVGADGVNSRIRGLLGLGRPHRALAIEGKVALAGLPSAVRFDFRYTDGGYGWVFPKGDHLNVGLYTQRDGVALSKQDLRTYAALAVGSERVEEIVGYPVGIDGCSDVAVHQRIFLAGDACGAAERLLGEGIHNAIKTGQAAATAILSAIHHGKPALMVWRKALKDVQHDLRACGEAAGWFYDMPAATFSGLATHRRWTHLMRGFAAGMTFRDIARTFLFSRFYRIAPVRSVIEYERGLS